MQFFVDIKRKDRPTGSDWGRSEEIKNGQTDRSLACTVVQCRVLRTISSVDGKHRTLAPCSTKTPSPIHTKFGMIDYVAEVNIFTNFGIEQ